MHSQNTQEVIDSVKEVIRDMYNKLENNEYETLLDFEEVCGSLHRLLQDVPVTNVQQYSEELKQIGTSLGKLREIMIVRRDAIREQLQDAGSSSTAAKAYLKSSLANADKKN